jgi:erythromycin esterase-like protein
MDIRMVPDGSFPTLGNYLRQQYGEDLVVFGFLFYRGSFHAMGIGSQSVTKTFHAAEPPGDSYEFFFQATGLSRFFLDMRPAQPDSQDQAWLFSPHPSYTVGVFYDPYNPHYFTSPLARMYDVVIYFKDTSPSILLDQ